MSNLKRIKYPKMNERLAELLGICFGDGCLCINKKKFDYLLFIAGHRIDDSSYMRNFVSKLIYDLFGLESKYQKMKKCNTLNICIRSKLMVKFLNRIGMPVGKKDNLKIPEVIKSDKELMQSFVRGFFDTDGTLTFMRNARRICVYPRISISSKNGSMIYEIKKFLISNGFKIGKVFHYYDRYYNKGYNGYRIFILGRYNFGRWIKTIGFSNPKHATKYNIWRKYGSCPPKLSTLERMKIISGERDLNPQPIGLWLSSSERTKRLDTADCSSH